jgi:DNA-binding winged helix-turn-helix (wHTH) protein
VIARFGSWTFDRDRRLLTHDVEGAVHLTAKAFDLLDLLIAEAPRVVGKEEPHHRLWPGAFVSDATLVGLVRDVRRALGDGGRRSSIVTTSHGVGYAFACPLERRSSRFDAADFWVIVGPRRIRVQGHEAVIGRNAVADVPLDAAGVSRRHARITVEGGIAYLEDLGSKNGTRVGSATCTERTVLHDGDQIHVGPVTIVFRATDVGLSTETVRLSVED